MMALGPNFAYQVCLKENNDDKHVHSTGAAANNILGQNVYIDINQLICTFLPLDYFFYNFSNIHVRGLSQKFVDTT